MVVTRVTLAGSEVTRAICSLLLVKDYKSDEESIPLHNNSCRHPILKEACQSSSSFEADTQTMQVEEQVRAERSFLSLAMIRLPDEESRAN